MQLEGLQSLRDNQLARLSAVINLSGTQPLENHISYTTPGDTIPGCISGKQGRVVHYPKEEHHHEIQTNGTF